MKGKPSFKKNNFNFWEELGISMTFFVYQLEYAVKLIEEALAVKIEKVGRNTLVVRPLEGHRFFVANVWGIGPRATCRFPILMTDAGTEEEKRLEVMGLDPTHRVFSPLDYGLLGETDEEKRKRTTDVNWYYYSYVNPEDVPVTICVLR